MSEADKKVYSQEEKLFLISIIEKHKNVLENKKTDAVNTQRKMQVWKQITQAYNSNFTNRSTKQLKKLWDNLKQRTRKADSALKNSMLQTGGGPPTDIGNDPICDLVRSVVQSINIEVENKWDSVAVTEMDKVSQETYTGDFEIVEEKIDFTNETNTDGELNDISLNSNEQCKEIDALPSVPSIDTSTEPSKKRKLKVMKQSERRHINDKGTLRIKKVKESIRQQEELHKLRMDIGQIEKMFWEKKISLLNENN